MSTCLWHASHPFQFRAIEVVGSCYLCLAVVYAFLAFLQIVAVVAPIGVDGLVVEFEDDRADAIEEESVVGHHQQRLVAPAEKSLQPLYHLKVEMVRRLVEYQQVGIGNQHIGQSHAFLLSATQLPHRLLQVTDLQLGENLLGLEHLLRVALVVETGIEHTLAGVEHRTLFEHAHAQITTEDDLS